MKHFERTVRIRFESAAFTRFGWLCLAWAGLVSLPAFAGSPEFPLDDLEPGTIATARTVFSGTEVDTFSVEIVSVVRGIGPKQDLILARANGERLEHVGIAQGMSGSPVFVGESLLGAISSTWSFTKEPMLGITPFGQMKREAEAGEHRRPAASGLIRPSAGNGPAPIGAPLVLAGFDPRLVAYADSLFAPYGFTIAQGGAGSAPSSPNAEVTPGSVLGVRLVGGDANMTALGTTTWVDGDRVYGWGHPFFALGEVRMPLVAGTIHAIVPSHMISFKLGSGGDVVGTMTRDQRSGISGRLGQGPPTTRLDLRVLRGGEAESYGFDVVRDETLQPILVGLVSTNAFFVAGGAIEEQTVGFTQRIVLDDGRETTVKTMLAGDQTVPQIASLLSEATRVVVTNPFEEVGIARIDAEIGFEPGVRLASITEVSAEADTLHAGDTLRGAYVLRDWRGEEREHPFSIESPKGARAGRYLLVVADGTSAEQFEAERNPRAFTPRSLDELLARIDRLRPTDRVHLLLYRQTQGVLVDGRPLPDLPLSALSVMRSASRSGVEEALPAELVRESQQPAGRFVQGSHTLRVQVKEKP
jgi:hypothetical protein